MLQSRPLCRFWKGYARLDFHSTHSARQACWDHRILALHIIGTDWADPSSPRTWPSQTAAEAILKLSASRGIRSTIW